MRAVSIAFAAALSAIAAVATAQDAPKEPAPAEVPKESAPPARARFTFAPVEGGYLRLDSTSGQVSFCSSGQGGWACRLVPDDRAAFEAEIARLQDEIGKLKGATAEAPPPRPPAELNPRAGRDDGGLRLPSREEVERARAAVERAWRRMVDMIYDFQKDVTKKD